MSVQIPVLYGTETGNAEECAEQLAQSISELGWSSEAVDLDDFEPSDICDLPLVFIVSSTHGNGDPPENAEALMDYLQEEDVVLNNVHFAVCGLGDRAYPYFAQCGKDFDKYMEARGGTRLLQRTDCDEDFELPFSEFKGNVIAYLSSEKNLVNQLLGLSSSTQTEAEVSPKEESKDTAKIREAPHMGHIKYKRKLSREGSAKETMHYEIDITGSGIEYKSGDCIGVFPRNNPSEVKAILAAVNLTGAENIVWKDNNYTLQTLLSKVVCLQRISVDLMNLLAEQPGEAQNAVQAGHSAMSDYMSNNHILDAVRSHKRALDAQVFASCLRRIQPRLYSIASSPKLLPSEVHFTIETLRYTWNNRSTEGVASTWFADRLNLGEKGSIPLYLHSNSKFRLPEDNRPIIMIGPGTGIAPFRAFLQEKEAGAFKGKTWLFFGHQHEAYDFLYEEDIKGYQEKGILNRLDLAWSRDQESKVYVQNKIWAHKEDLWQWIEEGANIYVCGDAQNMAEAVDQTLRLIARSFGKDASSWVQEMTQNLRYQRDVY